MATFLLILYYWYLKPFWNICAQSVWFEMLNSRPEIQTLSNNFLHIWFPGINLIFFLVVLQAVHHIFTNSIMEFYEEAFSLTYDLTTTHISKNMWEMFKIIYQVSICAKMLLQFDENFSLNLSMSLLILS